MSGLFSQILRKAESIDIDVIEINDKLCLNVAGIGLDSFVAHSFNEPETAWISALCMADI